MKKYAWGRHETTTLNKEVFSVVDAENYAFVESGTNLGCGISLALEHGFSEVYSIEPQEDFYRAATKRFAHHNNVHIYKGLSENVMCEICQNVNKPCFFWLDAHSDTYSPALKEIGAILLRNNDQDIIAVDDIRVFRSNIFWGKTIKLEDLLALLSSSHHISYCDTVNGKGDILIARKSTV